MSNLKSTDANSSSSTTTFEDLGLRDWAVKTCKELGMRKPTAVQAHCIPKILAGRDVLGLGQTGSGKRAAFAFPFLQRALGSCLRFRCSVIVGGMDMLTQTKSLISRSHVVIATPGRVKVLLENNPDIPAVFSRTKFLVLDEADRVLDVRFEEELRVVFQSLLSTNFTLLEVSANKEYSYEAYEGFKTVGTLKEQYLLHMLCPKMNDLGLRSAVIFVSTCRSCQLLSLLLEELGHEAAALHSMKSQDLRLYALHGSSLVSEEYVDCVGHTARAGRIGLAVGFVSQVALMKMRDDGCEERAQGRKKQNMKTLAEKELLDKRSEKRKR
ncbi:hypothetical protein UlMin_007534 [Ulmus minor]